MKKLVALVLAAMLLTTGCSTKDVYKRQVYGQTFKLVIGEWDSRRPQLQAQKDRLRDVRLVCPQRQSAWPLLASQDLPCRIEPGAWIRDVVEIGKNAVILLSLIHIYRRAVQEASCVGDRR